MTLALARRCLRALETFKDIDGAPTAEQHAHLRGWQGWGPLAPALERYSSPDGGWVKVREQVTGLLTRDEEQHAIQGTATAFYTPPVVVDAVWSLLADVGFTGGRVLEPGCGSGVFIEHAPALMPVDFTGVEIDPVTAGIAKLLHPGANIINAPLERTALRLASFDAVVGNVPFAEVTPYDPMFPSDEADGQPALHNYFLWRAVEATRPGGIIALVTSRYTMDAENPRFRQFIDKHAAFVGAIRLPTGAFSEFGTKVVTDIVVLRKRTGDEPDGPSAWEHAHQVENLQTAINGYWFRNPRMVLGAMRAKGGAQYGHVLDVVPPVGVNLEELLLGAVDRVCEHARKSGLLWLPDPSPGLDLGDGLVSPKGREGSFALHDDGAVTRIDGGRAVTVRATVELKELILLRDSAVALFDAEGDPDAPDASITPLRAHTRTLYEGYVARFGPLNRSNIRQGRVDDETGLPTVTRSTPPLGGIRIDPDFPTLLAIEDWDDDTETATPAPILLRRVNHRPVRKTHADTPAEAVTLCRDELGRFDLGRVAELLGVSRVEAIEAVEGLAFKDPATGAWEAADEYLSGDVRDKLRRAQAAAEDDPEQWGRNVAALTDVQPTDLGPFEIMAKLGAPWIPASDIAAFVSYLLDTRADWVTVKHEPYTASWEVTAPGGRRTAASWTRWGTSRVNAIDLIQHALNGSAPVVYDKEEIPDPDNPGRMKEIRVRNNEETQLADDRARKIQEEFGTWLWTDPERTDRLVKYYNDTYNAVRLRVFDGSGLTFPGLVDWFKPYQHQLDMVARIIGTGSAPPVYAEHEITRGGATLCGYGVGAGKTAIMYLAAMTMKRLGLVKKPVIIVPNHLLEQIASDGRRLYPAAKVLMVTKEDLTKKRRKAFAAKVAATDWDAIVMTHDQFRAIPVSPYIEAQYLADLIEKLQEATSGEGLAGTRTVKRIGKQIMKLKARHAKLMDQRRDDGLYFDRLGIDYVFADECFPYDTPVLTDQGELPIGEIVEKGLKVKIASVNRATGGIDYKPIHRWVRKANHAPLVRIVHERGEFTCTPNHPIWVEGRGYVKAEDLAAGAVLRTLPRGFRPGHPQAEVLRAKLPTNGGHGPAPGSVVGGGVPAVRGAVRAQLRGATGVQPVVRGEIYGSASASAAAAHLRVVRDNVHPGQQSNPAVLRESVRGVVADGATGTQGGHPRHAGGGLGGVAWPGTPGCAGADAHQQPDERPGGTGEGVVFDAGAHVVARPWWSGGCDSTAADVGRPTGPADGVAYQDPASGSSVLVAAELVRRGPCAPGIEDGDRGGRQLAQDPQVEIPGSPQDGGLGSSRVVSVEILEPRGTGRPGEGRGGDHFVYNLEVADNHNYFADGVLVSNCHYFKNLAASCRMEGFSMPGSKRAEDLFIKLGWLRKRTPDGRCATLFTGTPVTNTLAEVYTLLRYLDPGLLERMGLTSFDAFACMFVIFESKIEVAPDGSGFRLYRRPSKFCNVPELRLMLGGKSDIRTRRQLKLKGPKNVVRRIISVDPSPELEEIIADLVERADRIRSGGVRPDEDNMLAVCTEGRKAALDPRLVGRTPSTPGKVHAVARETATVYHAHCDRLYPSLADDGTLWMERPGSFQLVFCDLGTPGKAKGDQAYGWMKAEMVRLGIPEDEIRYIHDADSAADKKALFAACRDGRISVLIASTEKAGTGVNVQHRLVAIHHVDCTWRPDGIEQRDGRGDRPGNCNDTLLIFQYVTIRSFDPYMWQGNERKKRFIDQVTEGDPGVREIADVPSQDEQYFAMIKAVATGQERVMELEEAKAEAVRLQNLAAEHTRNQIRLRNEQEHYGSLMWEARRNAKILAAVAVTDGPRELDHWSHRASNPSQAAETLAEQARRALAYKRDVDAGKWRGVELQLTQSWVRGRPTVGFRLFAPREYKGVSFPVSAAWRKPDHEGLLLDAIDAAIDGAAVGAQQYAERADYYQTRIEDIEPLLRVPFEYETELTEARARRDRIEAEIADEMESKKAEQVAA